MIGKMIGAYAGERAARHVDGLNGTAGALLGVGSVTAIKKIGPFGLLAALAGGYALKRRLDHNRQERNHAKPAPKAGSGRAGAKSKK
ncbi:MAG TPA: hypothetical protein VEZ26_09820 [Sphingomonadaceae bacterium]|nr:hypothetical protein [Sphingomonadaceae bacterium]